MKLLIEELDRELPWGWVLLRREPSTKLSDGLIEMRFTGDINLIEQNILLAKQTASLEKSIEKVWAVLQKREPMISGHVAYATERIIASLEKELDARTEELSAASERAALAENWAADSMEELEECREKLGDALEINENQAKALVDYDAWAQRHRSVICGYKVGSEAFWRDKP